MTDAGIREVTMVLSASRLEGKRAIITGAGSGIGAATAIAFAREGAKVALIGRRKAALEAVAKKAAAVGNEALVLSCDVSDENDISRAFAAAEDRWGGLDCCVAVAGIELWEQGDDRVDRLELEIWQQVIAVNLTGMFLTLKYAVRAMLRVGGGAIVVTGSPTGLYGGALKQSAYSASKAGCHGLARVVANDVANESIRVNIVVPGFIDTPINSRRLAVDVAGIDAFLRRSPMHRLGRPEEVAAMNLWLCSDDASFCTGAYFFVDGGETSH
jgi:NAD(P)-dependent dehydrogenase (short-subunit alcohol dehydrogenase family)